MMELKINCGGLRNVLQHARVQDSSGMLRVWLIYSCVHRTTGTRNTDREMDLLFLQIAYPP